MNHLWAVLRPSWRHVGQFGAVLWAYLAPRACALQLRVLARAMVHANGQSHTLPWNARLKALRGGKKGVGEEGKYHLYLTA